jgi:hypothetical protein
MLIDTITHIYPKTASVFSPSLAFAAVIMLLLPNLSDLLASNNLDNTSQKKFEFREIINLTNNEKDSVYGQVSASNDNVYVVWQESVPGTVIRNYDILFKRSTNNGSTFDQEINLSNNPGFSEHPQISSVADNVYVIWADDTNGNNNKQVYFKKSNDNGNSFGEAIKLSNNNLSSFNQDIAAFDKNVYAVWLEKAFSGSSGPYRVMLAASEDGGNNFRDPVSLSENAREQSYPKISTFNSHVYVAWNVEDQANTNSKGGVFFISSSDNAATFDNISKLNTEENGFGKAQVASSGNEVYIIWGGSDNNKVSSLYFVKSYDNGRSFVDIKKIDETEQGKLNIPSNVEITVDEVNRLFIAWQDRVGTAEKEDILSAISLDGGESFESATNISNNTDISECPSIAMNGGNVYITWEDLTPGNHEILYRQGLVSF